LTELFQQQKVGRFSETQCRPIIFFLAQSNRNIIELHVLSIENCFRLAFLLRSLYTVEKIFSSKTALEVEPTTSGTFSSRDPLTISFEFVSR